MTHTLFPEKKSANCIANQDKASAPSIEDIIEFYDQRAARYGLSAKATLQDDYMRQLEIETAAQWMEPGDEVLDVCCGNGITSIELAKYCRRITGIDLSSRMIENARKQLRKCKNQSNNVFFEIGDVLKLHFPEKKFSTVISIRGLINLPTWEKQKHAILNIHSILQDRGKYIFIEGWREGLERINKLRQDFKLRPIAQPWHNCHFSDRQLSTFMGKYFTQKDQRDLDLYFLISRVLYPAACRPEEPQFEHICNRVAKMLVPFARIDQPASLLLCKLFVKK